MATADNSFGLEQQTGRYAPWTKNIVRPGYAPGTWHGGSKLIGSRPGVFSTGTTLFLTVVICCALGFSGYLAWVGLTSSKIAGCGGQLFDCNHVLQSKWSSFAGIPVGVLASGLYFTLLASLVVGSVSRSKMVQRFAAGMLTFGALSAGMAAIWFVTLQVFVVGHLCAYCLAAHVCGILLAASVLWLRPFPMRRMIQLSALGMFAVAILATGQVIAKAPAKFQIENHPAASQIGAEDPAGDSSGSEELFSARGSGESDSGRRANDPPVFEAPSHPDSERGLDDNQPLSVQHLSGLLPFVSLKYPALNALVVNSSAAIQVVQDGDSGKRADEVQETGQDQQESESSRKAEEQEPKRIVSVFGGKIRLDAAQWPILGSQKAKHVFVEMFDYTCPHCRANHRFVSETRQQLGDDLAVMLFSVPMCRDCNDTVQATDPAHAEACKLSELAIAVWRTSPESFPEFHEWLMSGEVAPNFASARQHAAEMVDPDELAVNLDSELPAQYVAKQVELYKAVGAGTVPKLLFTGTTVTGNIGSTETLIQVIQRQPVDEQATEKQDEASQKSAGGNGK